MNACMDYKEAVATMPPGAIIVAGDGSGCDSRLLALALGALNTYGRVAIVGVDPGTVNALRLGAELAEAAIRSVAEVRLKALGKLPQ